jgi:fructoselysine 6-kinase
MRILAIGDNCIDDYVELGKRFPGGNALNVAVYASRFDGVEADYLGVVGSDNNGEFLISQITKEGLSREHLIVKEGTTAVTKIVIRNGDRVFAEYIEGVQAEKQIDFKDIPEPNRYEIIHFTVWGFGREHIKTLKETTSALVSCDFSGQLDDPRIDVMRHLNVSFFSGSKIVEKGDDPVPIIKRLKEKTPGIIVMTLGAYGSLVYDGATLYRGEAKKVKIVDTLGAGDAYIAAFLLNTKKGKTIAESIKAGHVSAAKICERLGAWGGEP